MLWLTLHNERCAWKGFDWATTDRPYKKGMIGDPVNKSKSMVLTHEGLERSEAVYAAAAIAVFCAFHSHGRSSCRRETRRLSIAGEHLGEPCFGIDVIETAGGDEGEQDGSTIGPALGAGEGPVSTSEGNSSENLLHPKR